MPASAFPPPHAPTRQRSGFRILAARDGDCVTHEQSSPLAASRLGHQLAQEGWWVRIEQAVSGHWQAYCELPPVTCAALTVATA